MPSNGGEGKNPSSFTSPFVDLAVALSSVALAMADSQSSVASTMNIMPLMQLNMPRR
jgi:hypothetical protein